MPEDDTTEQLRRAMLQPKRVEVDDKTVQQHDLDDVIAMDKYLAAKKALARGKSGLRIGKMCAGGAV